MYHYHLLVPTLPRRRQTCLLFHWLPKMKVRLDPRDALSLADFVEENVTITSNRSLLSTKKKSQEYVASRFILGCGYLWLTPETYTFWQFRRTSPSSPIVYQTYRRAYLVGLHDLLNVYSYSCRRTEIQELRHKSQSSGDAAGTTSIIDESLMNLDAKLEAVTTGMKAVNESVEPLQSPTTPTFARNGESGERALLLRKHATLVEEWESVQDESDVLREELKEDKWLTVFRTVTEQADGMMSSLEKAVNRCQVSAGSLLN